MLCTQPDLASPSSVCPNSLFKQSSDWKVASKIGWLWSGSNGKARKKKNGGLGERVREREGELLGQVQAVRIQGGDWGGGKGGRWPCVRQEEHLCLLLRAHKRQEAKGGGGGVCAWGWDTTISNMSEDSPNTTGWIAWPNLRLSARLVISIWKKKKKEGSAVWIYQKSERVGDSEEGGKCNSHLKGQSSSVRAFLVLQIIIDDPRFTPKRRANNARANNSLPFQSKNSLLYMIYLQGVPQNVDKIPYFTLITLPIVTQMVLHFKVMCKQPLVHFEQQMFNMKCKLVVNICDSQFWIWKVKGWLFCLHVLTRA